MPGPTKKAKPIRVEDAGIEILEKIRLGPSDAKFLRELLKSPPEPNVRLVQAANIYISRQ